jgi:hypothetical protein
VEPRGASDHQQPGPGEDGPDGSGDALTGWDDTFNRDRR